MYDYVEQFVSFQERSFHLDCETILSRSYSYLKKKQKKNVEYLFGAIDDESLLSNGMCMLCHRNCLNHVNRRAPNNIVPNNVSNVSTPAIRSRLRMWEQKDEKTKMRKETKNEKEFDRRTESWMYEKIKERWESVKLEHGSWHYGMQQRTSLLGAWGVRMGPWGWNNKTKAVANKH